MRSTALLASVMLLVPQVAGAHVVRHSNIPQAYRGTWATSAEACAKSDAEALVLAAKTDVGRRSRALMWFGTAISRKPTGVHGRPVRTPARRAMQRRSSWRPRPMLAPART